MSSAGGRGSDRTSDRGGKRPRRPPVGTLVRRLAAEVLLRVECDDAWADALLGEALANERLGVADRALLTRLVYGTIAWQRRLDHAADRLTNKPVARLDPPVRVAIRLGLHQLLFLDRVPAFAAVATTVEAAKAIGAGRAAGLVNAVLRRAEREGSGEPPREALGLRWSHPDWLVTRWVEELGREHAEKLLEANAGAAPLVVRPAPGADLPPGAHPCRFAEGAFEIEGSEVGAVLERPELWTVQGEASILVGQLLATPDDPGALVLDACAAPGGKATQLAASGARVVATDRNRRGLTRARALANGIDLRLVRADAAVPPFRPGTFDRVLVDAPCSGTGTLRQHPEIRWRLEPEDVTALAALQLRILLAAIALVRPGGEIVYATCSLLREENEDVVAAAVRTIAGLERLDPADRLPEAARSLVAHGRFETSPGTSGLDGFRAFRLRRSSTENPGSSGG